MPNLFASAIASPPPPPMRMLYVPDPIAIHLNVVDGGDSQMDAIVDISPTCCLAIS